jgi:Fels-1 Prophage Protein-like
MLVMRYTVTLVAALLTLVGSGCTAPGHLGHGSGTGVWFGPAASMSYGTYSDRNRDLSPAFPGYGRGLRHRPAVACDSFGRCWQLRSADLFERRYAARARPPGWAEDLPRSGRSSDRFLRPRSNLVCDRASRICYKNGKIDKSDTERVFGERAGDRADDLRDRFGTARLFVPQRGVACDRERRVCLEDGDPDRKLTRRYFGRGAARALAKEGPQGG